MLDKRNSQDRNRNKLADGSKNLVGTRVRALRKAFAPKLTQEDLAGRVAALSISLDRTAIYRIEARTRAVTDIELVALAKALRVQVADLFPTRQGNSLK